MRRRQQRQQVQRVVRRLNNLSLSRAWLAWLDQHQLRCRLVRTGQSAVLRLRKKVLVQSFNTWAGDVAGAERPEASFRRFR